MNPSLDIDESAPVIMNCPGTTIAAAQPSVNFTVGFWNEPTASDPGGGVTSTSNYKPLDLFYLGDTVVTYVFTDQAGNEANCTFIVEVTGKSPHSRHGGLYTG